MSRRVILIHVLLCFFMVNGCSRLSEPSAGQQEPVIGNVIVYKEPGKFCGWPANNGIWNWGNEILVGFHLNYYKESLEHHSIDKDKPSERVMARSYDGGVSWKLEKPEAFSSTKAKPVWFAGQIDFTDPNFSLTCRSERFYFSYDRGKNWNGPFKLPLFGQDDVMARTDYVVDGRYDCHIFLTATKTNGREGRPFCVRTRDGGRTMNFVSWIGPEPTGYSIMPSTVRISQSKLVTAIRRYERGDINRGWISIYESNNNGDSWRLLSKAASTGAHGGNPPCMVKLSDGRLCVTYGYRSKPYGIRAKMSNDNGKTWSEIIHLREDGRTWDIGYTRTVVRPDGKLVTIYYYTTQENPEQHIAATIWDPDKI